MAPQFRGNVIGRPFDWQFHSRRAAAAAGGVANLSLRVYIRPTCFIPYIALHQRRRIKHSFITRGMRIKGVDFSWKYIANAVDFFPIARAVRWYLNWYVGFNEFLRNSFHVTTRGRETLLSLGVNVPRSWFARVVASSDPKSRVRFKVLNCGSFSRLPLDWFDKKHHSVVGNGPLTSSKAASTIVAQKSTTWVGASRCEMQERFSDAQCSYSVMCEVLTHVLHFSLSSSCICLLISVLSRSRLEFRRETPARCACFFQKNSHSAISDRWDTN